MASLSTFHLELVVWDGNLVKSLVKCFAKFKFSSCILSLQIHGSLVISSVLDTRTDTAKTQRETNHGFGSITLPFATTIKNITPVVY